MKKIVLFGDCNSFITTILYKEFIKELHGKFELIAVINTSKHNKNNLLKKFFIFIVKKIFNPFNKNIKLIKFPCFLKLVNKNINIIDCLNINDENFILKAARRSALLKKHGLELPVPSENHHG